MAVEKMVMLSIVGRLEHLDEIVLDVLKSESIDLVDAMTELSINNAIYQLDPNNVDMVVDLNNLGPFPQDLDMKKRADRAQKLVAYFNIEDLDLEGRDNGYTMADFDKLYNETKALRDEVEAIAEAHKRNESIAENLKLFNNVDVDLTELREMNYFTARFGRLEKSARLRLKENYDHILALIFHTGTYKDEEVYLAVYPNEVHEEIDRILNSLHWIDVPVLDHAEGTAKSTFERLQVEDKALTERLMAIDREKQDIYNNRREEIRGILAKVLTYGRLEEVKGKMARAKKYFLLSGWASESDYKAMKARAQQDDKVFITASDDVDDQLFTPPTKLKNNAFFRPFEMLVRMYGVPHYTEIDPTVFLGITYMVLFGAMFGDLGQGAVFFLVGLLLGKKYHSDFGPLLTRLGASSMIFGLLYGSVFGSEQLIPALWIRPFNNINQVLIFAIAFGVFLLVMAYALNFINAYRNRNLAEGLFGEHGLLGFVVFVMLILILLDAVGYLSVIPRGVAVGVIVLAVVVMIFKKPLLARITHTPPVYHEGKAGYFIESSFSIIELLISTLSGIVSFIRVGAFAINHVGLFMAFHTMAEMADHDVANVAILVLGNLLIIGLEGLIVFIQGLRLEYYELFSRYYKGSGVEFESDKLSYK
ncbi:ATPase [Peptoniphilus equinus]|uniref:ATPase n=1 Tax=Peptoniphilus equinus TaxID=3016343 RepID=A0ABY7QV34_9FIRM|nr:V-type ATPase 116kDa subunit family protein [Peptoniphilus equinus]WBW49768.1 ATPase [Peptoniphilus equinus]